MRPNLLILGGTTEASRLATRIAELGLDAVLSYAGRVAKPLEQPIPVRSGGFGGAQGLAAFLRDRRVTHLVDATHPFAARMSRHAAEAAAQAGVPLAAFVRPPWQATAGDNWHRVPDMQSAAKAIGNIPKNVFLGIGRQEIESFRIAPHHRYLLRVIDVPESPFALPDYDVVVARGPFDADGDRALLQAHDINVVVSKNSGGSGAIAKIQAARDLGLPVIMIDRPAMPERREFTTVDQVIDWLHHEGTDRGV